MPRKPGTTDAQNTFLCAYLTNPAGPPPEDWPAPAVFKRWLRRPTFRLALQNVRDALRYQSDLHLASASAHAGKSLDLLAASAHQLNDPAQIANCKSKIANATTLLRLAHLRQRFAPLDPAPRKRADLHRPELAIRTFREALHLLSLSDPNMPVGKVVDFWTERLDAAEENSTQPDPPKLSHHRA